MLKFWMAELYHHVPQMNAPPNKLVLARGLIAIWVNLKDSWTLISLNSSYQVIWEIFHDYFGPEHLSIEKRGLYLSQARNDETTTGGHHQQPRPRGAKCNSWRRDFSDDWKIESLDKVTSFLLSLNVLTATKWTYT